MPTLKARVDKLETRAAVTDYKLKSLRTQLDDLQEWQQGEDKLREIDRQRIALLEAAKKIYDGRFRSLRAKLRRGR